MSATLEGKVAIVTGAASGIGLATVRRFAQAGAKLVAFDRSEGVHRVAAALVESGHDVVAVTGDAGLETDVIALVDHAETQFGRLDIFYANAGVSGGAPGGIFDATPEIWAETLRINLIGPFLAVKHAAPRIARRGGGALLCTASVAGLRSGAGPANYSASKAGVINLVQTAAQQLAGSGVRINAICPGLIETGMTSAAYERARASGKIDRIGQINPLLRGGEPEEIAELALFLVSEAASYIHGQAIAADGGLSTSHPTTRRPADIKAAAGW
jgi:NAD(P)-dependent dehydrogenase (short-subunit alcohol dehydrogenase family)